MPARLKRTTPALLLAAAMAGGCTQDPVEADLRGTDASSRIPALVKAGGTDEPKTVADLVHALLDEDPAVRLFAIQSLNKRFGQTLGYRYYASVDERQAGVDRWRQWLSEHAGIDLTDDQVYGLDDEQTDEQTDKQISETEPADEHQHKE